MIIFKEIYKTLVDWIVDLRETRKQLIWISMFLFMWSAVHGVDNTVLLTIAGLLTIVFTFYFAIFCFYFWFQVGRSKFLSFEIVSILRIAIQGLSKCPYSIIVTKSSINLILLCVQCNDLSKDGLDLEFVSSGVTEVFDDISQIWASDQECR